MSIQSTRAALTALADHLEVDPGLPSELTSAGVDHITVGEVVEAVELGTRPRLAGLQAEAEAARSLAQALEAAAAAAAHRVQAGIDERHGPIAEAITAVGGPTEVADPGW